jgi:hypothetical protein
VRLAVGPAFDEHHVEPVLEQRGHGVPVDGCSQTTSRARSSAARSASRRCRSRDRGRRASAPRAGRSRCAASSARARARALRVGMRVETTIRNPAVQRAPGGGRARCRRRRGADPVVVRNALKQPRACGRGSAVMVERDRAAAASPRSSEAVACQTPIPPSIAMKSA